MKDYDYSFLNNLSLPQGLLSVQASIRRLDCLLTQRLAHSPRQRKNVEENGLAAAVSGASQLNGSSFPEYGHALREISTHFSTMDFTSKDFLCINQWIVPHGAYTGIENSQAVDLAVSAYSSAKTDVDPLLLIPCVLLDMICTAPFQSASSGTALLLARLLLCRCGFPACWFMPIEQNMCRYYFFYQRAQKESSLYWAENHNDYLPYMQIFLSLLYLSYQRTLAAIPTQRLTKRARIEELVLSRETPISKADICAALPEVSPTTVEAVLGLMVKAGSIRRVGGGRGTKYLRA